MRTTAARLAAVPFGLRCHGWSPTHTGSLCRRESSEVPGLRARAAAVYVMLCYVMPCTTNCAHSTDADRARIEEPRITAVGEDGGCTSMYTTQ